MATTIKDLEQYRKLQKEILNTSKRLESMPKSPSRIVSDSVKGSSHDLRAREQVITITGLDMRNRLKYEKLQRIYEDRVTRQTKTILKIETFIDTIEDSNIRNIINCRYIQGLSWAATAQRVYGYPSESIARMAIKRYFKKQETQNAMLLTFQK